MNGVSRTRRRRLLLGALGWCFGSPLAARALAHVHHAQHGTAATAAPALPAQAMLALFGRVAEALARAGEPLDEGLCREVETLTGADRLDEASVMARAGLDRRVLLELRLTAEARASVRRQTSRAELVQGGWRLFLVRVLNPARVPGRLRVFSPSAVPVHGVTPSGPSPEPPAQQPTRRGDLHLRWMELAVNETPPLDAELEALPLDYKLIEIYARDAGLRSAALAVDIGPGTADIGGRDRASISFLIAPARRVALTLREPEGRPLWASLRVRDEQGRIVPAQTRRSPPDMFFQQRVYRGDGQALLLPPGRYRVEIGRGPEYRARETLLEVPAQGEAHWRFSLTRWIDPAARGWYSGDHHIHAAGCAHYAEPEIGVAPADILPQVMGEGLSIGAVLSWAPGFEAQRRHFSGRDDPVSTPDHRLRYDLEVSGFPSSHCGHLALLRMREIDYPGTTRIEQWPSSNAPVLRWARSQGAVCGYVHAGAGLWAGVDELPNYRMPRFDGIGANDFIVTLVAGLVDFIGVCNHPQAAELNIWYHTLNVGLRSMTAGETDWPCFFEESVGMGRSYVHLPRGLDYEAWCEGLRRGRAYVSDGRVHLLDFEASAHGQRAVSGGDLVLAAPALLRLQVDLAARLEPQPTPVTEALRALAPMEKPYWHIERARIGASRMIQVELLVNGVPFESRAVPADERLQRLAFEFTPTRSCWVALRVRDAAHSNPIWITVADSPLAVAASARWCRDAVEQCWRQKSLRIRPDELANERALYESAQRFYTTRIEAALP